MRWSFINGIMVGAIGGAVLGMMYGPQMKPTPNKYLMGKTRRLGKRTGLMMRELADDVQDWVGKH